jgi:hypothetical protein
MTTQPLHRLTDDIAEGSVKETAQTEFQIGLVTADKKPNQSVQKKIDFIDGRAVKDPKHSLNVYSGQFDDRTVTGMAGLAALIAGLTPRQALTLGVCGLDQTQKIVTAKDFEKRMGDFDIAGQDKNLITRTKKHIKLPDSPHFLLLDVDAEPGKTAMTPQELRSLLTTLSPAFSSVGSVTTQSTSSGIYLKKTGEKLIGKGNYHIFIPVRGDVDRFSEALKTKFWANDNGFFKLGSPNAQTGVSAILERFPIDMCVLSGERLVYEAGAKLSPELGQKRGEPNVLEGTILDLDSIVVTDDEIVRAKSHRERSRAETVAKRKERAIDCICEKDTSVTREDAEKQATRLIQDVENGVLTRDHVLYLEDGTEITAGELTKAHLWKKLRDPQEPDYCGGRFCAQVIPVKGGVGISSFAHGERKYSIAPPEGKKSTSSKSRKKRNDDGGGDDGDEPQKRAIADQLIDIGRAENISYFVTPDDRVYADVTNDGIRRTMVLRGKQFKQYLRSTQFENTERSPGSDAVQQAIDTLEALAVKNADKRDVHVRLAEHDEKIYIDLADESWKSIEVDRHGWRVVEDAPVRFIRGASSPLPMPIAGGRVEDFKELCQFSDDAWVVILTFLLQALKPEKAYPILFLVAPPATGKTTITRAFKNLVDPSPGQPRKAVGEVRDFAIHATKRHVLPIDNLSGVTNEQSDILCCAATGGGHSQRTLHSDDEETVIDFTNLLVLNGIGEIATRGDLLSRAYPVTLTAPKKRLSELEFAAKFEELRPGVLGALFTLLSQVLAVLPDVRGTYTGDGERFVSFVELGLALEQVMNWKPGTFLRVIGETREEAHDTAIESSPIGEPLRALMDLNETWSGTMTALLQKLKSLVDDSVARSKFFPQNSTGLGKALARLHSDLAATGIEVRTRKTNGVKIVEIVKRPTQKVLDVFVATVEAVPSPEEFVLRTPDIDPAVSEEEVEYEYVEADEPPATPDLGDWDESDEFDELMAVGDNQ